MPTQRSGRSASMNGNGIWKPIAIALISIVGTAALGLWTFTRGSASIEQLRDLKIGMDNDLKAQAVVVKEGLQKLTEMTKTLDDQLKTVTREQDRRGGRLEKIEDSVSRLEARIIAVESVQGSIAAFRVELRVLQEAQARIEDLLRTLHDRFPRRPEPPSEPPPRGRLPRGFP